VVKVAAQIAQGASELLAEQQRPYMVALVGPPGGGKTVGAFLLANLLEEQGLGTMILPYVHC